MIYAWRAWRVQSVEYRLPLPPREFGETPGEYWSRLGEFGDTPAVARHHVLTSIAGGIGLYEYWPHDKPMRAYCRVMAMTNGFPVSPHEPGNPPFPSCTCGLWCTKTLSIPLGYLNEPDRSLPHGLFPGFFSPGVIGVAGLWGKIVPHNLGYRAEYGRPVALAVVHDGLPYRELSQRYDIPVYPTVKALGTEFNLL